MSGRFRVADSITSVWRRGMVRRRFSRWGRMFYPVFRLLGRVRSFSDVEPGRRSSRVPPTPSWLRHPGWAGHIHHLPTWAAHSGGRRCRGPHAQARWMALDTISTHPDSGRCAVADDARWSFLLGWVECCATLEPSRAVMTRRESKPPRSAQSHTRWGSCQLTSTCMRMDATPSAVVRASQSRTARSWRRPAHSVRLLRHRPADPPCGPAKLDPAEAKNPLGQADDGIDQATSPLNPSAEGPAASNSRVSVGQKVAASLPGSAGGAIARRPRSAAVTPPTRRFSSWSKVRRATA